MMRSSLHTFKRWFNIDDNNFEIVGAKATSDGVRVSFSADKIIDNMNLGILKKVYWLQQTSGDAVIQPVAGKAVNLYSQADVGAWAEIRFRQGIKPIASSQESVVEFGILGQTAGGNSIKPNIGQDPSEGECIFIGLKKDTENYVGVVWRDAGTSMQSYLVTCEKGTENISAGLGIATEQNSNQKIRFNLTEGNVELYVDDVLVATSTLNVPNYLPLKPWVHVENREEADDCYISINYVKIQQ